MFKKQREFNRGHADINFYTAANNTDNTVSSSSESCLKNQDNATAKRRSSSLIIMNSFKCSLVSRGKSRERNHLSKKDKDQQAKTTKRDVATRRRSTIDCAIRAHTDINFYAADNDDNTISSSESSTAESSQSIDEQQKHLSNLARVAGVAKRRSSSLVIFKPSSLVLREEMNRRKFKSKDKKKQDHQRARKTHGVAKRRHPL